jgi:hypothetical protein
MIVMTEHRSIFSRAPMAWLMAALVCLPLAGRAFADDAPATQPADNALTVGSDPAVDAKPTDVAKWFNQLDDADAAVRDAAYNKLLLLKSADLDALKQAVKAAQPLRPAQESALPGIVKQAYLSGMDYDGDASEGFLGVSLQDRDMTMQGTEPPQGVPHVGMLVSRCMPGFCGARVLREGDVILSIAERPDVKVEGSQLFAQAIRSFNAGQVIHLNILRQGQVIKAAVALDARPVDLNGENAEFAVQDMLHHRDDAAEAYWSKDFAPLFKSGPS